MKKILSFSFLILGICSLQALTQAPEKHSNLGKKNLAIQGYDAVSYFTVSKAVKGNKEYSADYNGGTYLFANKKNQNTFIKSPMKYEPQYGGWCAYAMGIDGSKVKVDPETFKVLDDKLYLFYNFYFTNTLPKWNDDEGNLKAKADDLWKKITD